MKPEDIFIMKCGYKSVWDYKVYFFVDDEGIPCISGWYKENEEDKRTHREFKYLKDNWVEINPKTRRPLVISLNDAACKLTDAINSILRIKLLKPTNIRTVGGTVVFDDERKNTGKAYSISIGG